MSATKIAFDTYFLKTKTDASGRFKEAHGLKFDDIHGMVVAVEDKERCWHTVEYSNKLDNRFFWNNEIVAGAMEATAFASAPVQIILFVKALLVKPL